MQPRTNNLNTIEELPSVFFYGGKKTKAQMSPQGSPNYSPSIIKYKACTIILVTIQCTKINAQFKALINSKLKPRISQVLINMPIT